MTFRIMCKGLFVAMLFSSVLCGNILTAKYPSYTYVFHEFDVDESYIYDESFSTFVKKNEKKLKRFYERSLSRGEALLPLLQGLLIKDGVSDLFIYLSMIESGFSTDIVSPKKAVGLWQFMPATAKHYNLKVCSTYDERCDAVSATSAAMRYLNKLHRQFGKWYLAAMAYNCGEGCVSKAIRRAGTDDLTVLTDNHLKYLPKETREYIKKILLIAMIGESSTIGLDETIESANGLVEVEVSRQTSLAEIAKIIKMDKTKLLKLNRQYKNGIISNEKDYYTLMIPMEKIYAFYLRYEMPVSMEEKKEFKSHMITHRVRLGETLETIAKKYSADVEEIRVVNHLEFPYLELDFLLVIPVSKKVFENLSE